MIPILTCRRSMATLAPASPSPRGRRRRSRQREETLPWVWTLPPPQGISWLWFLLLLSLLLLLWGSVLQKAGWARPTSYHLNESFACYPLIGFFRQQERFCPLLTTRPPPSQTPCSRTRPAWLPPFWRPPPSWHRHRQRTRRRWPTPTWRRRWRRMKPLSLTMHPISVRPNPPPRWCWDR